MSFPTSNLVAQYEPWRWGYADNTTYDASTSKVQDSSGTGHHCTSVNGTPKHRTNILNGLAAMRFDGASAVSDNNFARLDPVTLAALFIPRALGGSGFFPWGAFNNGSSDAVPQLGGYHSTNSKIYGYDGTNTFDGTTVLTVGTAYVVTGIFDSSTQSRIRLNGVEESNISSAAFRAEARWSMGAAIGANLANAWQVDVLAAFIYAANLVATQALTDLEAYLTTLQTTGASVAYTDALSPGSYSLSGQNIVTQTLLEHVAPGSYTLTGQNVAQAYGQAVAPGSFSLTGQGITEVAGAESAPGEGTAGPRIWLPQPHGFHGGRR